MKNYLSIFFLFVSLGCNISSWAQCNISVTMASGSQAWGDATTWSLLNGNGVAVLSGGTYGSSYNDVQTYTAVTPPYTLVINVANNSWCDNDGTYLVSVGGVTDLIGNQSSIQCGGTLTLPLNTNLSGCGGTPPPPPPSAQCNISVTMASGSQGWGDATTWSLLNGNGVAVLSGGTYGSSFNDVQTYTAVTPPYTLVINVANNSWCDNDGTYLVSVGGVTDLIGNQSSIQCGGTLTLPLNTNLSGCGGTPPPPPPPPSPGDNCANAITIACGGSDAGTTVGRPTDAIPFTCGTINGTGGKVWYTFTGTGDGVTASLCSGTFYDSKLWIYSGSCGAFTCVGGNDDGCGPQSTVTFTSVLGTTYYIVVGGFGANQGAYNLALTCAPPPPCSTNETATPDPACDNQNLVFSWDAVAGVTGYFITLGTTSGGGQIANNLNVGNITSIPFLDPSINTTYYWTVTPYNSIGSAIGCVEQSYTTGGNTCICAPLYSSGTNSGDLISAVSISGTTLENNVGFISGQPSYLNYYDVYTSNQTGSLTAGTSYTVTVSTGEWGNQGIRAWVDFNGDNIFSADEAIGATPTVIGSGYTPGMVNATGTFTISLPCNPTPGDYRMRVRGVYNLNGPNIDPCLQYTWGQTHDYRVTILPPPPCPTPSGLTASNVTFNAADINWTTGCTETAWQYALTTSATPPASGTASATTSFSASSLMPSTVYYVHVRANCDVNGFSSWITTSFTTPAAPPANDQICDAINVTSSGSTSLNTYGFLSEMSCNNQTGNNSAATPSPVGATCAGSNGSSMWYTFTTPACAVGGVVPFAIELTTNNTGTDFDTKLSIFESSDNTCSGTLTQIACNDDNFGVGNPAMCGTAGVMTSTLVQTNLLPNKQYWVYIDGFNAATGNFVLSGRAATAPHGVITTGAGTQIQLSTNNMGAGLYSYYYQQVGTSGYSVSNSQTSLTDIRTLSPGNDYLTQVMYRCGTNSDESQWYRTSPQTITLENQCALVTDMTCTFNGPNSYTLSWPQPAGELFTNNGAWSGYRIKRNPVGTTSVFTFSNPAVVCTNGTCSVTLAGNNPNGFNWTIETRCSATTVQIGNTSTCGPQAPELPNNPSAMVAVKASERTHSFKNIEAGIEFVDVQMFDAYADFGLNTPMTGDYEIYVNTNNEVNWRRVDTSIDANFDFVIVPNPSNAITTVFLNTIVEEGTFTIVDAMGRTIQTGSINNTDNVNFDAAQLQSGVYLVVVTVGNQKMTRRLVVAD